MKAKICKLKRRLNLATGDRDDLLLDLLEDAEMAILSYTGRDFLPAALGGVQVEMAMTSFNLLGLEGMSAYSEGAVSSSVDRLPASMRARLEMHRIARVG